MRTVNIADLKNNLSAHLERVRAGEELRWSSFAGHDPLAICLL